MFIINPDKITWANDLNKIDIKNKKIEFLHALTSSLPREFQQIQKYVRIAYDLNFEEDPDYNKLKTIIEDLDQVKI
jgi:hypothetical protein